MHYTSFLSTNCKIWKSIITLHGKLENGQSSFWSIFTLHKTFVRFGQSKTVVVLNADNLAKKGPITLEKHERNSYKPDGVQTTINTSERHAIYLLHFRKACRLPLTLPKGIQTIFNTSERHAIYLLHSRKACKQHLPLPKGTQTTFNTSERHANCLWHFRKACKLPLSRLRFFFI